MRNYLLIATAILLVNGFCGCSSHKGQVQSFLNIKGDSELLADAKLLKQKGIKNADGSFSSDSWPMTLQEMKPMRIKPFMFGIFLEFEINDEYLSGLYIVLDEKGLPPEDGSGVSIVDTITEHTYWIRIKIRRPVRPMNLV